MKLFADNTSLFSIVRDPNTSANELNKDFSKDILMAISKQKVI